MSERAVLTVKVVFVVLLVVLAVVVMNATAGNVSAQMGTLAGLGLSG
jgi:hypothetical protein